MLFKNVANDVNIILIITLEKQDPPVESTVEPQISHFTLWKKWYQITGGKPRNYHEIVLT